MYSKLIGSDYVIIYLYVDDKLVLCANVHVGNETKKLLSSHSNLN